MSKLIICISLLSLTLTTWADINVSYVTLVENASYESNRVYAGQVVASRTASLGFKLNGRVAAVAVDIGESVTEGQILARLDSTELQANVRSAVANVAVAQANVAAYQAELLLANNTEKRYRRLYNDGHTPKQTYDETYLALRVKQSQLGVAKAQLIQAQASLDATRVTLTEASIQAPFNGVIQTRHVDEGTQVTPGAPILRLVEKNRLEAHIGIPPQVAARLSPNTHYTLNWNEQQVSAELASILPEMDSATRTQTAILTIQNPTLLPLALGATVELNITERISAGGFWLPLGALTQGSRGLWSVYVIEPENVVSRRLVEIIHTETNRVFARGTLAEGDRVIDNGVHRIVPGQAVEPTASWGVSHAG